MSAIDAKTTPVAGAVQAAQPDALYELEMSSHKFFICASLRMQYPAK